MRALIDRLGLTPDSPQLRIIATSASFDDDADSRKYLEEFFGLGADTFAVIPGYEKSLPSGKNLDEAAERFTRSGVVLATSPASAASELGGNTPETELEGTDQLARVLSESGALEAVRQAGKSGPFTVEDLAVNVFKSADVAATAAARALLRCVVVARTGDGLAPLPLRVHYFFHNAGRLWACINTDCSGAHRSPTTGTDAPPVGRLYAEPRPFCDACNAAVLEMLYCQPCGEVFLGGFHKVDPSSPNAWFLSPDYPDLDRVPDRSASLNRTLSEYMVFWPSGDRRLARVTHQTGPRWQWQQDGQPGWQWTPALLDHQGARITRPPRAQAPQPGRTSGYMFIGPSPDANAFPSKCPHCGADWSRRRTNSPIRDLGSGFQRVVQLLCDPIETAGTRVEEIGPLLGQPAGRGEIVYGHQASASLGHAPADCLSEAGKRVGDDYREVRGGSQESPCCGDASGPLNASRRRLAYLPTRRRSAKRSSMTWRLRCRVRCCATPPSAVRRLTRSRLR